MKPPIRSDMETKQGDRSKRAYTVTLTFTKEFNRKVKPQRIRADFSKITPQDGWRKTAVTISSKVVRPPKPRQPSRYQLTDAEKDFFREAQKLAEKFARVIDVKKPKVVLANVKGAKCKLPMRCSAHVHMSRSYTHRIARGTICINHNRLQWIRDAKYLPELLADEVAHLRFRKHHQHRNKKFQELEKQLLSENVISI